MTDTTGVTLDGASNLIGSVAWPLVVLIIALIFRRPLTALLRREDVEIKAPGGLSVSAKSQEAATDALVEASTSKPGRPIAREDAATGVEGAALGVEALGRPPQLLWVDDRPSNNRHEVAALTSLGMHISLSTSTEDALTKLARHGAYDLIISDMSRPPDDEAGYTLLDALRRRDEPTPFLIYASSRSAEHFDQAVKRGAIGCTNRPDELVELVTNALRSKRI